MQEANIELRGLKFLRNDDVGDIYRECRDNALDRVQEVLKPWVDASIVRSGVRDRHGKVRRWQTTFRKKGYVAVRAEASSSGPDSPGAITNYLESGHKIQLRIGKTNLFRQHHGADRVPGFFFYRDVKPLVEKLKTQVGDEMEREIAVRLEAL